MLRFSKALVPDGKVPSAGIRLTGISSPRPASILAVTRRTKSGALGRDDRRTVDWPLVAAAGTFTSKRRASVPSTAAKFLAHHRLALAAVGLADRLLDVVDRRLARQHAGDREEAGLQDGVGAPAEPDVAGDLRGVDDEEAEPLVDDLLLHRARQAVPDLVRPARAVEQEHAAGRGEPQHVLALEEAELVAGDEIRPRAIR